MTNEELAGRLCDVVVAMRDDHARVKHNLGYTDRVSLGLQLSAAVEKLVNAVVQLRA